MMVYSRKWLLCSLFLLYFRLRLSGSQGQPEAPTISAPTDSFYEGVIFNLTCTAPPADADSYTWFVNGQNTSSSPDPEFTLNLTSDLVGGNLTCAYTTLNSSALSNYSDVLRLDVDPLPAPMLTPLDEIQTVRHGEDFRLLCAADGYLLGQITAYRFRSVSDDGASSLSLHSLPFQVFNASQFQTNYSCAYSIGQEESPFSAETTVVATVIIGVNTTASMSSAFYGQNVTFTCVIHTDPGVVPPPGGDLYTVKWFDDAGNLEAVTQELTLEVTAGPSGMDYVCHAAVNNDIFVVGTLAPVKTQKLPRPTVVIPSPAYLFEGNTYTFMCNSSAANKVLITEYQWMVEETLVNVTGTNQLEIIMPPLSVNVTCRNFLGAFNSPWDQVEMVIVTALPAPQITVLNPRGLFFSGSNYTFSCASNFSGYATSYSFNFKSDDSLSTTQTGQSIDITADVSNPHNFTCVIHNFNSSSPESPPFLMNVVEIPKPNVPAPDIYYFSGNTYVFQCQAPPMESVNYTSFTWKHNGTDVIIQGSNQMRFTMPEPPYALSITCLSLIDSHTSAESDLLVVFVSEIPQPTIVVSPDHGLFINGTSYTFTCNSTFSSVATEYSFNFVNDSDLDRNQVPPFLTLLADSVQSYEFSCIVSNFNSSSDPSEPFSVVATVPSPPTIDVLDVPPHYLVGTQYALECQSDLEDLVTRYCLKNFTTDTTCQRSKRFNFTAEESEQFLQCNTFFDEVFTAYGQGVSVIGSGVVEAIASADTLTPYPGTNVTLTCIVILTVGYDESDVTFSWREGELLWTRTKMAYLYVTNSMEKSFYCEGTTGLVNVSSKVLNITARDLPTPQIEVQNRPANNSYEPGHFYTFVCNSELEDLLTFYNWYKDDELVDDVHSKHYLVQAMSYTHLYTCTYGVRTEESSGSSNVMIATESILSVHVESSGLRKTTWTPVFNSTLTLICEASIKSTATEIPSYNWLQNGIQVGTGPELIIFAYPGYHYAIVCEVTVGDHNMASNEVTITSRADLPPPEISLTTYQVGQVVSQASYTLDCISSSLSLNSSVTWYKDDNKIACLQDLKLDITRYNPSIHDGQYTCEITVFGETAMSATTTMEGISPGKHCQESAECPSEGESFTGVCQDQRCVCSDGYRPRFNTCVLA